MKAFKHIFQTLINSKDGIVTYTKQIFDIRLNKNQEEINKNKLDNPPGGTDGQVLTKKGNSVIWKTIDPKDQYIGESGTGKHSEIFNDYVNNKAEGDYSHVEGSNNTVDGLASHAEGYQTSALKDTAHSEGYKTAAISDSSHAEGFGTTSSGQGSHAEGFGQELTAYDLIITKISGQNVTVNSVNANIKAGFVYKISLNNKNLLYTYYIVSIAGNVITFDKTDGLSTGTYKIKQANGVSHGEYSHTEGIRCVATHTAAHAEGGATLATNWAAHAEGGDTIAKGMYSHAEGFKTIASLNHQHVQGRCNKELQDAADIIGWGLSEDNRKNIEATKINGTKWLLLDVTCGGTYEQPAHKLSKKLNNPSGGSVGQVLTKTETDVAWTTIPNGGDSTYVLPKATDNALGGVKTGYITNGKNYPIVLDEDGKMYVNVPWENTTIIKETISLNMDALPEEASAGVELTDEQLTQCGLSKNLIKRIFEEDDTEFIINMLSNKEPNNLILKKVPFTRSKNITNGETYYTIVIDTVVIYRALFSFVYNETTGVVSYLAG